LEQFIRLLLVVVVLAVLHREVQELMVLILLLQALLLQWVVEQVVVVMVDQDYQDHQGVQVVAELVEVQGLHQVEVQELQVKVMLAVQGLQDLLQVLMGRQGVVVLVLPEQMLEQVKEELMEVLV
jgi:hypothetical protein